MLRVKCSWYPQVGWGMLRVKCSWYPQVGWGMDAESEV